MAYGSVNADLMTTSDGVSSSGLYGFKNRILNGQMVIDQRNAGASVTPTDGQYTLDRWKGFASQTSKYTVQQNAGSVTPPVGFTNYLGVTSSSAYSVGTNDYFAIVQLIEGYNTADLNWGTANAQTITISFWVRSSLTGTFGGALNNSGSARNYPFTYTISSANTWEQKSITITGDTSGTWLTTNGVGIQVNIGLGVGTTYSGTAGAWAAGNKVSATGAVSDVGTSGATFYLTGVMLEKGSTATSFDYRPYSAELAMCQRYFQVLGSGVGEIGYATYASAASQVMYYTIPYAVTMRTAPTATNSTAYSTGNCTGPTYTLGTGAVRFEIVSSAAGRVACSGGVTQLSSEL